MSGNIDPINSRNYTAISANLIVKDLHAAVSFYKNAFGFTERGGIMNGPDGKPIHAELRLRDSTLMLSPESPARGAKSASTMGGRRLRLTCRPRTWMQWLRKRSSWGPERMVR